MRRPILVIAISLLAGFVAAALVFGPEPARTDVSPGAEPELYFDSSAAVEDRIAALEAIVAQERNARLLLEDELQALYSELEALAANRPQPDEAPQAEITGSREDFEDFRRSRAASDSENRLGLLVDAGFSPDRAQWILTRESELQMARMQAIYEARQAGERPDPMLMNPDGALRGEIGDTEYERYLEATGRPTAVRIETVLESSPGQRAGLQPGDEIVAYGGERVFSYADLSNAIMSRQSGQDVVVDVVRDGAPMQVVIDSGPIGISNRYPGMRPRR